MNKYQDALNHLRNSVLVTDHKQKDRVNQCTELLQNLIHEHFDNPPLKFEELEVGMWVWDDKLKEWCVLGSFWKDALNRYYVGGLSDSPWEQNRFYRKQVEE